MKKEIFLLSLLLFWGKGVYGGVSAGAIVIDDKEKSIIDQNEKIKKSIEEYRGDIVESASNKTSIIFHRGGSDYYPSNLKAKELKDINELFDLSVARGADGFEIDVHHNSFDENDEKESRGIYIYHGGSFSEAQRSFFDKNPKVKEYLAKNSFKNFLKHYVDNYIRKNDFSKSIYVELKVPFMSPRKKDKLNTILKGQEHPKLCENDKKMTSGIDTILREILNDKTLTGEQKKAFKKNIGFISFNNYGLSDLNTKLTSQENIRKIDGDYDGFKFYQIFTTTNKVEGNLICHFGVPFTNDMVIDSLKNNQWFAGVWYDPRIVSRDLLDSIDEERVKKWGEQYRLERGVAAYSKSKGDFVKYLNEEATYYKNKGRKLPWNQVIVDINDKDPQSFKNKTLRLLPFSF